MSYSFKQIKLSDAEKLWLTEIMKADFSPIDVRCMKIKLFKELPEDFDVKSIDWMLVRDNRLTLLGLWHVNPDSPIFTHVSKTIKATKELIMKDPSIKEVTAKQIAGLVGITEQQAEIAILLVHDLPGFFGGGGQTKGHPGWRVANFSQDDSAYDKFVRFKNLEQSMEDFFVGRNLRINARKKTSSKGQPMATSATVWKHPSSREIWSDIYQDYEINKRAFAKKINFVTDKYKRKALFRDIEHAHILSKSGFSKPAVILAGSVIEELLRIYLESKNVKPANKTFNAYIKACDQNNFLKGAISQLSDSVRRFRNLVHLAGETSSRHSISKAKAKSAVTSIFIISNDFQKS